MFFLFSLWWILRVEGRVKVSSTKVSSGISECTHNMSSPNIIWVIVVHNRRGS
ncbi:Bgt-55017 [Blumeria graminis f. sp. tritici]|uniref:Bgt-55016 n=1 Tax=Blumeria graminis f. sp. tritici TaxID=62690 RepID=A0A9X9L8V5_BLUGR|nr:Bgt-55016 [Blumeria graminis f. sp. tritici]VCU39919.1 Bgt-55017 [Blumeria graminis f. sp. tritici]